MTGSCCADCGANTETHMNFCEECSSVTNVAEFEQIKEKIWNVIDELEELKYEDRDIAIALKKVAKQFWNDSLQMEEFETQ